MAAHYLDFVVHKDRDFPIHNNVSVFPITFDMRGLEQITLFRYTDWLIESL